MALMKIFSGSEILATALKLKLEEAGIDTLLKNNIQSGRLAGFGTSGMAVELFIEEVHYGKADPIVEDFRMSI